MTRKSQPLIEIDLPGRSQGDRAPIHSNGTGLNRLVYDPMDQICSDFTALELNPEAVIPNALLTEVFRAMSAGLSSLREVTWRLELPESLPEISVDPWSLRQIMRNLLGNAHRFTKTGHITLGALPTVGELHVWVGDTGPGLSLEQQRLLRTLIFAGRSWHLSDGLGRGLRMVLELIRAHNGRILFSSPPGSGVTFHIYLPLPQPRCHPHQEISRQRLLEAPPSTLPHEPYLPVHTHVLTRQIVAYLRQNYAADHLSRNQIAASIATSERYLTYVFHRDLGITPWQYLTRLRIEQAKTLLHSKDLSATEIAFRVGFNDSAYFSRIFHRETGRSPSAFRRQV